MTPQEKQLLLRDLCARLPYGVKVEIDGYGTHILKDIDGDTISTDRGINYPLRLVKPYLRQMPDIQDPLLNELDDLIANKKFYEITAISQDWYNEHHFDHRGLIEKGLALEAPEGMYNTKQKLIMGYKEKYEMALEGIQEILGSGADSIKMSRLQLRLQGIFPELKESEDEKIKKGIKSVLEHYKESGEIVCPYPFVSIDEALAWLEKQGKEEYALKPFKDEDVRKFMQYIEKEAKAYEFNLPNRGYDIHAFAKDILVWLEKQGEPKEKPTKEQVWDYCNKISSEWWQITMDKWNTLADEDKNKYNQFIGFNDFSDMLMNITAGALFQLIDTGKLEYEDGSLLLEKPDDTPKPLEVTNAINEKQGEQKTTNKVEPKFKVGDWVVHNRNDHSREIMQIYDIRDGRYYFNDNVHFSWSIKECDEKSRLWTVLSDAKDGDVLVLNNNVFIYAHRRQMYSIAVAHCFVDSTGSFYLDGEFGYKEFGKTISPATKEQRDLLSQKMKEAGYEWDSEKKELNKIEQKHACGEDDKDALDEDYISFETAKLLNEKGFKQECDYATSWYAKQYYKNSCQGEWFEGKHQIIEDIEDKCNISYLSSMNIFIPAPTLQMAMKWLREIYDLHVVTRKDFFNGTYTGRIYDGRRENVFDKEDYIGFVGCETYEKACEAAIKYCLENLI